ncbi:MAG: hypothetical protein PHU25_14935 [Deltaproteobacteria bacterium]|nr:hypothetical protein [Deltaproteobacteria bacterium]
MRAVRVPLVVAAFVLAACSPAAIVHIGPPLPARPSGCGVEVLKDGTPSRPYRDVGLVELSNCQDYRVPPCRLWLEDAACELGGQVAYLPSEGRTQSGMGPVTFRVMVAAYLFELRPDPDANPVDKALSCRDAGVPAGEAAPERCRD